MDLGPTDRDGPVAAMFLEILGRTHLSTPADVADIAASAARHCGASALALYLISYEQDQFLPVPGREVPPRGPIPVDGTDAGRCFQGSTELDLPAAPGRRRLWLPLLDGTERLGVVEIELDSPQPLPRRYLMIWERYVHLLAQLVVAKAHYGDAFELIRRTRPMDASAEMLWALAPPLVFATEALVVSAMLEPCYEGGGDAFDYAVNHDRTHAAVFDAMGHGDAAAGLAAFAVTWYRSARRRGLDLPATYAALDTAVVEHYGGERYVTAVLADLDVRTGHLRWVNAGHPAPLLVRGSRIAKQLESPPTTPLGVPFPLPVEVGQEQLEPGDLVLFYTDGLPEARLPDGEFFGVDRLAAYVEKHAAAGNPAPETLRQLRSSVLAHQRGRLQDDATALLLSWRRPEDLAIVPDTVF